MSLSKAAKIILEECMAVSSGESVLIVIDKNKRKIGEALLKKAEKITEANLVEIPVASVNEAMQGRLAGVNVINNSGSPGSGLKVIIRGVGTNGNAEPLYVVDGAVVGDIDQIEPYDVESVEVLKDAASAAIYGASAANGVVLITTKQGKERPSEITYNMQIGSSSIGKYTEPMDASS